MRVPVDRPTRAFACRPPLIASRMRILILGGTVFVGRHLAEAARARGHEVTLFHRGTRPDALPDFEHLHGDRNEPGGLDALRDRTWDAAIDTSGYVPRQLREALDVLDGRVGRYAFVSSISVYDEPFGDGPDEDAPVIELDDPDTERVDVHYGGLKVLCERVLRDRLGDRALIVRPGLIVGPHDPTERFPYWVRRMTLPGPVLIPDALDRPLQWIDARDLAAFVLDGLEDGRSGTYNLVSEENRHTLGDVLDACQRAAGTDPERVVVSEAFLEEHDIAPFVELPLWLPRGWAGFMRTSSARARAAGLRPRSLQASVEDVLAWVHEREEARHDGEASRWVPPWEREDRPGPERERALIRAWRERFEAG